MTSQNATIWIFVSCSRGTAAPQPGRRTEWQRMAAHPLREEFDIGVELSGCLASGADGIRAVNLRNEDRAKALDAGRSVCAAPC
jgi:hypothetical protein